MSTEIIKPPDNTITSTVKHTGKIVYVKYNGSCIKQDKITFNHEKIVNIYTVYDLKSNLNNFDPTLGNCLFPAMKFRSLEAKENYQRGQLGSCLTISRLSLKNTHTTANILKSKMKTFEF